MKPDKIKPEPYEMENDQIKKKEREAYTCSLTEQKSLKSIKKSFENQDYKSKKQIEKHQEYLEGLYNKLLNIRKEEKAQGIINWEVDKVIREARTLFNSLDNLKKKMRK